MNAFPIKMPPLRERRDDIPLLTHFFMERMASHLSKKVKSVSEDTIEALREYEWPGNVRELEHVIQRAVILAPADAIRRSDLFFQTTRPPEMLSETGLSLEEMERHYILQVVEQTRWVIAGPLGAASRLGLNDSTLRSRMRKLGIRRPDTRP